MAASNFAASLERFASFKANEIVFVRFMNIN